jgi:hypothetical protein
MTLVIPPPRYPYLYSNGDDDNYTTYSPLYANPGARTARPQRYRGTQDETWPQHVAPADEEAKKSTPVASLHYRGNCSHRIRRKMAAPEATFFVFLFYLFPISSFYHECNPSPPLGTIKGEAGATSRGIETSNERRNKHTHTPPRQPHTSPPRKRPVIHSLFRKLVTPTTSTPVQGNMSSSSIIYWT